ncbi:MAG TPA: hypothetical protein VJ246_00935 [Patescibacteria group bacterium]|nr:hypothetical protein [Patescibacteria group bacterium]
MANTKQENAKALAAHMREVTEQQLTFLTKSEQKAFLQGIISALAQRDMEATYTNLNLLKMMVDALAEGLQVVEAKAELTTQRDGKNAIEWLKVRTFQAFVSMIDSNVQQDAALN